MFFSKLIYILIKSRIIETLPHRPWPLTLVDHTKSEDGAVILALLFRVASKTRVLASILEGDVPQQDGDVVVVPHKLHPLSIYIYMWHHPFWWYHWIAHLIGPTSCQSSKTTIFKLPKPERECFSQTQDFLPSAWCRCHWIASWSRGSRCRYSSSMCKATLLYCRSRPPGRESSLQTSQGLEQTTCLSRRENTTRINLQQCWVNTECVCYWIKLIFII